MIISIQNLITGNMIVAQNEEVAKIYIESFIKTQTPFSVDYGHRL